MTDRTPKPHLIKLITFGNKVESIQVFIGIFCVVSFLFFVTLDVLARTIKMPIISAQEISIFSFVWAVYTGGSIAFRKNTHFKIDAIITRLPEKVKKWFNIIECILSGIFISILIGAGWRYAMLGIKRVSNPSGIPLIIPTIAFPICGIFFMYFLIERFICVLENWNVNSICEYIEEKKEGNVS